MLKGNIAIKRRKVHKSGPCSLSINLLPAFIKRHGIKAGDTVIVIAGDILKIIPESIGNSEADTPA